MASATILIVDDDPHQLNLLTRTLEMGQFHVVATADGPSALEAARELQPDLYVLDVGMPGMSGIELCRRLRAERVIAPILMLTGMDSEADKVAGLEAGADDYQTKPFAARELLARVNALLRRLNVYSSVADVAAFVSGDLRVDFDQHLAYKANRPVNLTPTEFRILAFLARTPGQIRSSGSILADVWGPEYSNEVHVLRVNVARLRNKIEADASHPRYVHTHLRVGYSLSANNDD